MKQGDLIKIDKTRTLFWGMNSFMEYHTMIDIPIAIFLEFDDTGIYAKVFWNGKIGWVNAISVSLWRNKNDLRRIAKAKQ